MNRLEQIRRLTMMLLAEMPQYCGQAESFPMEEAAQRRLLRGLMNLRPPMPLKEDFLALQDELLSAEREDRGVIDGAALPAVDGHPSLVLWQGDITRLRADAIVNAANSALLGCFCPCHGCIDNAIHSAAGLQLREACHQIMEAQGYPEPVGRAKLTRGYNLPARYVLHTVGPMVQGRVTRRDTEALASCYRACLETAASHGLESVAFCCVSTGEYRFLNQEAAEIAVNTVTDVLRQNACIKRVIFNVFKESDARIYRRLLGVH